jgi:hypothetical protein
MRLFLASLLATALLASGCGKEPEKKDKEEESFAPIEVFGAPCPPANVVSWENFAQGWIMRQCLPCHSAELLEGQRADAPLGVDFNTYEDVRFWADNMFLRAAYNHTTMPPAGGPYPEDRVLFGDWMACQAPRESDMNQE